MSTRQVSRACTAKENIFSFSVRCFLSGGRMSFPCPHCHDSGTQKVSLLYESSIRRGTNGHGGGNVSQSDLAARLAPPQPRKRVWPIISVILIWMAGSFVGGCVGLLFHSGLAILIPWAALIGGIVWQVKQAKKHKETFQPELLRWNSQFICKSCGEIFIPSESDIPDFAAVS
jgi:hypothetical protein